MAVVYKPSTCERTRDSATLRNCRCRNSSAIPFDLHETDSKGYARSCFT